MIPNYIKDWLKVIELMNNDNTYKLAICSQYKVKKAVRVNIEELI